MEAMREHEVPEWYICLLYTSIAQNKVGLKNLYQMISASNLKDCRRVPTVPKSLLREHREGVLVGSACEAGELFRAVAESPGNRRRRQCA